MHTSYILCTFFFFKTLALIWHSGNTSLKPEPHETNPKTNFCPYTTNYIQKTKIWRRSPITGKNTPHTEWALCPTRSHFRTVRDSIHDKICFWESQVHCSFFLFTQLLLHWMAPAASFYQHGCGKQIKKIRRKSKNGPNMWKCRLISCRWHVTQAACPRHCSHRQKALYGQHAAVACPLHVGLIIRD